MSGEYRKRGFSKIKKTSANVGVTINDTKLVALPIERIVDRFKSREIIIHPTLLSYQKCKSNATSNNLHILLDVNRAIDKKRDFLLAPLGNTEITQVGETVLVLVSKRLVKRNKSEKSKYADKSIIRQQLTLKFETRDERDVWMDEIILECDKVYLEGLIDSETYCMDGFIEKANLEIWSRILLGDEILRKAYIARAGSDHIAFVREIIIVVINWLQLLLGIEKLESIHKEVFVALFTLLLHDTAARAVFILLRPDSDFFSDFRYAKDSGVYHIDEKITNLEIVETLKTLEVLKNFIHCVKFAVNRASWQKYRVFLTIVDHPSMKAIASSTAVGNSIITEYIEHTIDPALELTWLRNLCVAGVYQPSKFSWEMFSHALSDTPYLSYYFVTREIRDIIDDTRVRRMLLLLKRIPDEQLRATFTADRAAKSVRQHFQALIDYCKFRELWKLLHVYHMSRDEFYDAVHQEIWARIAMGNDVWLRKLFLPTLVRQSVTFCDVLSYEMAVSSDWELLGSLQITPVPVSVENGYEASDANRATLTMRSFAINRLVKWVEHITNKTILTADEAPIYVDLLTAAAKHPVVRAVLCLTIPAKTALREHITVMPSADANTFTNGILNALVEYCDTHSRSARFLSFLTICEHPLVGDAVDQSELPWWTEQQWMTKFPQSSWSLPLAAQSIKLMLSDTPYLSLQLLLRRYHQEGYSCLECLQLLQKLPKHILDACFTADVNMCAVNADHHFGAQDMRTGLHFLTFVDSRKVTEIWKIFRTEFLCSSTVIDSSQNQLLLMLERQRAQSNSSKNDFAKVVLKLNNVVSNSVTFGNLIHYYVQTKVHARDDMWCVLLSLFQTGSVSNVRAVHSVSVETGGSVDANSSLKSEHLESFKVYIDTLAKWCMNLFSHSTLKDSTAVAFADLLSACLDNPVMRAVCAIVVPSRSTAMFGDLEVLQLLSEVISAVQSHRNHNQMLFLLNWLDYPGITQGDNNSFVLTESEWLLESTWLQSVSQKVKLEFDHVDFTLLIDPAYLLFRYISRNFQTMSDSVHTVVNQLQNLLPGTLDLMFSVQVNYLPCRNIQNLNVIAPVMAPHFKHMLKYCLFHEVWQIVLVGLLNPVYDESFVQTVVYEVWRLVNSSTSTSHLSKIFLPVESDIQSDSRLVYTTVLQHSSIATIAEEQKVLLTKLYPNITATIVGFGAFDIKELAGHHLLIARILKWIQCLLGDDHILVECDAVLFVELLSACVADVAMRALICTFIPGSTTIIDFMTSEHYDSDEVVPSVDGAVQFVKLLASTFRSEKWLEYRSFLNVLQHPTVGAGTLKETEPLWTVISNEDSKETSKVRCLSESEWVVERLKMKSEKIFWQEFEYLLTNSPYILLLVVTKGLPLMRQKEALCDIPAKYLTATFSSKFLNQSVQRVGEVPHFIAMCLDNSTSNYALSVFRERNMINDKFFSDLLNEACFDSSCPRLLKVFCLLQDLLFVKDGRFATLNFEVIQLIPNISFVLINFLCDIANRDNFRMDEKIIGNLVMLVFQLESYKSDWQISNITTLPNELLRGDREFTVKFFNMLEGFSFVKWFSRLCWKFNSHFGKVSPRPPSPVLNFTSVYKPIVAPSTTAKVDSVGVDSDDEANFADVGDTEIFLDDTIQLTKTRLVMSIVGFFNLCVEFNPDCLSAFVAGLGTGRPFFSYFLHRHETLRDQCLQSLCSIMQIDCVSSLYARIHNRYIFYDNDHTTQSAVAAIGLRRSNGSSACINLTDVEFTDLLTVAMYMHDVRNMSIRFEHAVISMIADQERREMTVKFMKWVISYFIDVDVKAENDVNNTKTNERKKWAKCEKFDKITFEDIIECSGEATISSHLLRGSARSNSYTTLERLFLHYIQNSPPNVWKELFRGSKTIAYFIKYVDVEDLNLAFEKFYEMNPGNNCFKHHLLKVRKMMTEPVISAQDLIKLTSSSSSFDENNSTRFFNQLYLKANTLPAEHVDLKIVYRLTASWMKISKEKVLFPLPPRNAQIITLLTVASWAKSLLGKQKDRRMGKALIAQVGTGEGKSLIIAMMAIYFVKVLKKRVHVLENNLGLLDKDVQTMQPLYAEFNIKTRADGTASRANPDLTWTTVEKLQSKDCRDEFCKYGVTYCLRRNLERYYQDSVLAGDESPLKDTVLIVDEVDDLIVDSNPNQPFATDDSERATFAKACEHLKTYGEIHEDFIGNFVWELAESAKNEANGMVLNEHYAEIGSRFVRLDTKGNAIDAYAYSLEYLKYVKYNEPPKLKSTFYIQSIPYILSQYDCITGFSGSLGSPSEREFLRQQYKAWSFDTPSFLNTCTNVFKVPPKLMDDVRCKDVACVHVYATEDLQFKKIIEMCTTLYMNVPVLIIAKTTEEAIAIEAKLKQHLTSSRNSDEFVQLFLQYKLFTDTDGVTKPTLTLDKENWGRIVHRATSKKKEEDRYCITITDPFGGRGHDFDCHDDEVERLGGLAVIMTSIPASEREWKQWKGRTARKDNKGQYAVVLCSKDAPIGDQPNMLRDYVLKDTHERPLPNLYEERVIEKLLEMQDQTQLTNLRNLATNILNGRRMNRLCDQYYENYNVMREETWPADANEVKLRNLLTNPLSGTGAIDKAFRDLELQEFDEHTNDCEPPNMRSNVFWDEDKELEWEDISEAAVEIANRGTSATSQITMDEDEESFQDNVVETVVSETVQLQNMGENFLLNPSALPPPEKKETESVKRVSSVVNMFEKSISAAASQLLTPSRRGSVSKGPSLQFVPPPPPPPKQDNKKVTRESKRVAAVEPEHSSEDDYSETEETILNLAELGSRTSVTPNRQTSTSTSPLKVEAEISDDDYQEVIMPPAAPTAAEIAAADTQARIAARKAKKQQAADVLNSSKAPVVELTAHENDLCDDAEEDAPKQGIKPTKQKKASVAKEAEVEYTVKPVVAPVDTTTSSSIQSTIGVTTSATHIQAAVSSALSFTSIQAATSGEAKSTTGKTAMSLAQAAQRVMETKKLSAFCVGDTVKLTVSMTTQISEQLLEAKRNDPLVIGIYDITGDNAGKYVPGLEVSGIIIKSSMSYTLIFNAKVNPELYQYFLTIYGNKRMVAKWNNVVVFEQAQVQFKPTATLKPFTSYVFHNAQNASRIATSGQIRISSLDDPRSATTPVFADRLLPYTGGPVRLPTDLPDGVITIIPLIPGFSEEPERFLQYNKEFTASESQVNLNPTNLVGGEWRVVLTWGTAPRDLDLYCKTNFTPDIVYFGAKNANGRDDPNRGSIELDVDVTGGLGPETITFTPDITKKYRFFVHNYTGQSGSGSTPIYESSAKLIVHRAGASSITYEIPKDITVNSQGKDGTFWHVFDLMCGQIVPVNEVIFENLRNKTLV